MKYLICIASLFFIYSSSFSQTQSSKGFVILNNDERVDGFISLSSGNKNPLKIRFSHDPSLKEAVNYNVSDLKSFEIFEHDSYLRANVLTDIRPFHYTIELPAKLDSFRSETVWLRELIRGQYVSLYEFYDTRAHYFVSDSAGRFKELMYKVGRENDRAYDIRLYIIQLQQLLKKFNYQSNASFMTTKYNQYDLVKAVNSINGNSTKKNAVLKRDLKTHYSIFVGPGAGMATAKLSEEGYTITKFNFKNKIFPFAVAGIDFYPGRKPGRLAIRLDVTYNSIDYNGTAMHPLFRETTYDLNQTNIIPSVSALVNFVDKQHLKLYFGPSVSYYFSSYKGNEIVFSYPYENRISDFLFLRKRWLTFDIRAGAKINNALEIALKGELAGKFQRESGYIFSAKKYSIGIAYHFLRKL